MVRLSRQERTETDGGHADTRSNPGSMRDERRQGKTQGDGADDGEGNPGFSSKQHRRGPKVARDCNRQLHIGEKKASEHIVPQTEFGGVRSVAARA